MPEDSFLLSILTDGRIDDIVQNAAALSARVKYEMLSEAMVDELSQLPYVIYMYIYSVCWCVWYLQMYYYFCAIAM